MPEVGQLFCSTYRRGCRRHQGRSRSRLRRRGGWTPKRSSARVIRWRTIPFRAWSRNSLGSSSRSRGPGRAVTKQRQSTTWQWQVVTCQTIWKRCRRTSFVKMVEANLLEDITDAYTMYASQRWQDIWAEYGELPWIFTTVNGRKYGLPRVEDLAHNDNILWYRQDWFDALGLGVPQTLDELHDTALAIVEADIGKGAPGTTIGLLANKSYSATWFGSIDPIWAPHGVVPRHWTEVGGELVFDSVRNEMREPLALLNSVVPGRRIPRGLLHDKHVGLDSRTWLRARAAYITRLRGARGWTQCATIRRRCGPLQTILPARMVSEHGTLRTTSAAAPAVSGKGWSTSIRFSRSRTSCTN